MWIMGTELGSSVGMGMLRAGQGRTVENRDISKTLLEYTEDVVPASAYELSQETGH